MANYYDKDTLPSVIRGALVRYDGMIFTADELTKFVLSRWGISRTYRDAVREEVERQLALEERAAANADERVWALEHAQRFIDRVNKLMNTPFGTNVLKALTPTDRQRFFRLVNAWDWDTIAEIRNWAPADEEPQP
jgi:hypothetical protein